VDKHVERASGTLGTLASIGFAPADPDIVHRLAKVKKFLAMGCG
jgi:hypothetical protein